MNNIFSTLLFTLAVAFLAFLYGAAVGILRIYPYETIYAAYITGHALLNESDDGDASVNQLHQLYPARYDEAGVTVYEKDAAQPGITLVTSYWFDDDHWQPAIRLLDMEGAVLHEWQIRPEEIWPESPYDDHVAGTLNNPNNYVHGAWLLPDGDIVFNVEYAGLVRMNACGKVVWTVPHRTHHSVFQSDDGSFWVASLNWRYETIDNYIHPKPTFVDEAVLQISPEGEILRELSILNSIYSSGYGGIFADVSKNYDITHMNDVEILSVDMADSFPMFEAGDILVSLRNLSIVMVLDGETGLIKWHLRHPLLRQHDPDFEPDGYIVIFDNRDDMTQEGLRLGSTRLLKVNPQDNSYETVYPLSDDQTFYTQTGGKHQLLDNGNRLITEAHGGRIFEIDPAGHLVWNWIIETQGDGWVPEVLEGSRYPAHMANFVSTACPAD